MRIDRAGIPFIAGAFGVALALMLFGLTEWALPFAMLAGFFTFFFRDPSRKVPAQPGAVVSPADGRVVHAGEPEASAAPSGSWQQVSIFLSPLDVHVNRAPIGGKVTRVEYQSGNFLPAYRREAAIENERCETWIEHDGQLVVCRQVVGRAGAAGRLPASAGDERRPGAAIRYHEVRLPDRPLRAHAGIACRSRWETACGAARRSWRF